MFTAMFTAVSRCHKSGSMLLVNMGEHDLKACAWNKKKRREYRVYALKTTHHVHPCSPPSVSPTTARVWWGEHAGEHAVNMPFRRGACSPGNGEVTP
jgi:hypothetical protein